MRAPPRACAEAVGGGQGGGAAGVLLQELGQLVLKGRIGGGLCVGGLQFAQRGDQCFGHKGAAIGAIVGAVGEWVGLSVIRR